MTIAEIHGKLPLSTSEDMLTANVFGAFRYLPAGTGIVGFLRSIKGLGDAVPEPQREAMAAYVFWPLGQTREPDVLLELTIDGVLYHVVVEAKYLSGPSDAELVEVEEEKETVLWGNQLADQMRDLAHGAYTVWRGGKRNRPKRLASEPENRFLLYLTAHAARPRSTLETSAALVSDDKVRLFWSSWYHVSDYLQEQAGTLHQFPYRRIVSDIVTLLALKQFRTFQGIRPLPKTVGPAGDGRFWTGRDTPLTEFDGIQEPPRQLLRGLRAGFWKEKRDD